MATAERQILMHYNGNPNFMTPYTDDFGWIDPDCTIAYELSHGSGITRGTTIWGVSVVTRKADGSTESHDGSQGGFSTREDAVEHIRSLQREYDTCGS